LDATRELDLQPPGKVEPVVSLHDVRDAALAGLTVHADHSLVGPADVLRVDRQVWDIPHRVVRRKRVEPLLDRVLV